MLKLSAYEDTRALRDTKASELLKDIAESKTFLPDLKPHKMDAFEQLQNCMHTCPGLPVVTKVHALYYALGPLDIE